MRRKEALCDKKSRFEFQVPYDVSRLLCRQFDAADGGSNTKANPTEDVFVVSELFDT